MVDLVEIAGGTFVPSSHAYIDNSGKRIFSVTQVFSTLGMTSYDEISKEVLARKSAIGVAVHTAVQYLCENALDWDTVDEVAMPYVVGIEQWMKEQQFISESQETQGIHSVNGMTYGYMYDHLGSLIYKGRPRKAILDLKTTVTISNTCKLQTAAYALAAPKLPPGERYLRIILQARADGTTRPYYYEDKTDEAAWTYALFTCIWGINNGLYTLEK